MIAAVENMAYAHNFHQFDSKVPWHGLGTPVTDENLLYDSEGFAKEAGFENLTVNKEPLMTVSKAQVALDYAYKTNPEQEKCPELNSDINIFAIKRSDGKVLGSCGKVWQPYQPQQAFDWFKPWLEDKKLAFNTAGSLNGGSIMWVLAQICENAEADVVNGDKILQFVMMSNPFDGRSSISVGLTNIRVVCANTLSLAIKSKFSKIVKIRHSSRTDDTMVMMQDALNLAQREFQVSVEGYQQLAKSAINKDDLRKYVRILINEKNADIPWDKLPTRTQNTIEKIEANMQDSRQKLPGVSGTWWAAYNSFNQYLNYDYGRKDTKGQDSRITSLWFKSNADLNKKALDLALSMSA